MKKSIAAALVLMVMIACSRQPAEISGTIKGLEDVFTIMNMDELSEDTIAVNPDGSFLYRMSSDKACICMLAASGQGTLRNMFLPGEKYHYDIDLTVKPAEWKSDGSHQEDDNAYLFYKDTLTNSRLRQNTYSIPESFTDHAAYCDSCERSAIARFSSLKSRIAREYLTKKAKSYYLSLKFRFAWNLQVKGKRIDSDADFNEFAASLDLNDESVPKSIMHELIRYWTDIYSDTLNPAISEIKAIDKVVPDQHTKDSLINKCIDIRITNGKVESEEEGAALIAVAEKTLKDEGRIEAYRQMIAKTLSLNGSDWIDFEMADLNGKTIRLSDLKGKALYIDFWASWCIPCIMQTPHMEKLAEKYKDDRRIVFVSVSMDKDLDSWKSMLDHGKPFWPQYVAKDGGKEIYKAYGFRGIPRFMLFDKDGKIVSADAPRPQEAEDASRLIDSILK